MTAGLSSSTGARGAAAPHPSPPQAAEQLSVARSPSGVGSARPGPGPSPHSSSLARHSRAKSGELGEALCGARAPPPPRSPTPWTSIDRSGTHTAAQRWLSKGSCFRGAARRGSRPGQRAEREAWAGDPLSLPTLYTSYIPCAHISPPPPPTPSSPNLYLLQTFFPRRTAAPAGCTPLNARKSIVGSTPSSARRLFDGANLLSFISPSLLLVSTPRRFRSRRGR